MYTPTRTYISTLLGIYILSLPLGLFAAAPTNPPSTYTGNPGGRFQEYFNNIITGSDGTCGGVDTFVTGFVTSGPDYGKKSCRSINNVVNSLITTFLSSFMTNNIGTSPGNVMGGFDASGNVVWIPSTPASPSQWVTNAPSIYYDGGNVGIGVGNNPSQRLDVSGNIQTSGTFISTAPNGTAPFSVSSNTLVIGLNTQFLNGNESDDFFKEDPIFPPVGKYIPRIGAIGNTLSNSMIYQTDDSKIGIGSNTPSHTLYVNGNQKVETNLVVGGNIGIGTASPLSKLHVVSGDNEMARFTSTDPLPFISLYSGNTRRTTLSIDGLDTRLRSVTGNIYLKSGDFDALTVSGSNIGIGIENPTKTLDIAGDVRIGGSLQILDASVGPDKVLTSDANGNATWKSPGSLTNPASNGFPPGYVERYANIGEDIYSDWGPQEYSPQTDTCSGGGEEYTCGTSDVKNCIDALSYMAVECGGESGGCASYPRYKSRNIQCIATQILVKDGAYCSVPYPTCESEGRCNLTQNASSANEGWIKDDASCGYSCINGWTGANCEIAPCWETLYQGVPERSYSPPNPYTEMYKVTIGRRDLSTWFCRPGTTTAERENYTVPRQQRSGGFGPTFPIGNNFYDAGGYGVFFINNTPGNYRIRKSCEVDNTRPECASTCPTDPETGLCIPNDQNP